MGPVFMYKFSTSVQLMIILSITLSIFIECGRIKTDTKTTTETPCDKTTTEAPNDETTTKIPHAGTATRTRRNHTKSKSRIEGGRHEHNVPAWHGTLWHTPLAKELPKGSDHRFAGHTINLGEEKFLAATPAVNQIMATQDAYPNHMSEQSILHIPSSPAKFNAKYGIDNKTVQSYGFKQDENAQIPGQMGLFRRYQSDTAVRAPLVVEVPKLETNKNEFGKDCRLYNWGKSLNTQQAASGDRHYQSIPVELDGACVPGECKLRVPFRQKGALCVGTSDIGSPVLCGSDKKLTYLASQKGETENGICMTNFHAHHVPSFHDQLANG